MNYRDNAVALEMQPISTRRAGWDQPMGRTEIASVGDRVGAYLLDAVFIAVGGVILLLIGLIESWLLMWVGVHTYFLVSELAFRKSLGKRILDLEVVNASHLRASGGQIFVRALLRPIDDFFWSAVGLISISSSDDNQRIGDRVAGTVVVKKI
ncbi:hypothetical protein BH23CHL2_BH23CHL2_23450 [soil metagenome]